MNPSQQLHTRLMSLRAERASASLEGLAGNRLYMDDLLGDIESTRTAYVGAAVTEIASFRAQMSRQQLG